MSGRITGRQRAWTGKTTVVRHGERPQGTNFWKPPVIIEEARIGAPRDESGPRVGRFPVCGDDDDGTRDLFAWKGLSKDLAVKRAKENCSLGVLGRQAKPTLLQEPTGPRAMREEEDRHERSGRRNPVGGGHRFVLSEVLSEDEKGKDVCPPRGIRSISFPHWYGTMVRVLLSPWFAKMPRRSLEDL